MLCCGLLQGVQQSEVAQCSHEESQGGGARQEGRPRPCRCHVHRPARSQGRPVKTLRAISQPALRGHKNTALDYVSQVYCPGPPTAAVVSGVRNTEEVEILTFHSLLLSLSP